MLGGLMMWGLFKEKPAFAAILRVPFAILMPVIVFVCAIGAYAVNSTAPMLLALVLGDMAEMAFRQSLIMSQGSPWRAAHAGRAG